MARKQFKKQCEDCAKPYMAGSSNGRFCSYECNANYMRRSRVRSGPAPVVPCAGCGEPMKKLGPDHIYCMATKCRRLKWQQDWRDKWAPMVMAQIEREAAWETVRKRREILAWIRKDDAFGSERWREQQQQRFKIEIETAVAASDDLRALVEAQERDQRFNLYAGATWQRSLDEPAGDFGTLLDFLGSHGRMVGRGVVTPDFTDALIAYMDRKREIDAWAEEVAA